MNLFGIEAKRVIRYEEMSDEMFEKWMPIFEADRIKPFDYKQIKPIYDPFQVFSPSKSFLQDVLRQLRQQSFVLAQAQQGLPIWADWLKEDLKARQKPIIGRIKQIQYRLKAFERTGAWAVPETKGRITDQDIARAKEVPISNFYEGRLRPAGKNRMMGICPFHSESSPSFVYYVDQNSFSCYGCNVSGSVVDYIMLRDKVDFIGAIKFLIL